jgi:opacity protein-like surface antigen
MGYNKNPMANLPILPGLCVALTLHFCGAAALAFQPGSPSSETASGSTFTGAAGTQAGPGGSSALAPSGSVTDVPKIRHMPFEFSPNVGFMGGSALIGLRASMGFPVSCELAVDQVIGRTATLYPITVNAKLDLANSARTVPYGIVGGGLFLTVPLNSVGDQTISSVGLCFGGGLRYYLNSKIGIRFETKQLFTRIDNQQDHRKELLIFQSSSLGVIFAFG